MDKNQIMINFIKTCPAINSCPLYFNFAEENDNINHFIAETDPNAVKTFIDGSILRQYTFSIISYKSIAHNPLIDREGYIDENVGDLAQVQSIIDWINEQEDEHNYPDFGTNTQIERMWCITDDPDLHGVDVTKNPPLAKYSVVIRLEYLDTSKVIFQKGE